MKRSGILLAGGIALALTASAHGADMSAGVPVKAPAAAAVPPTSGFASLYGGGSWSKQESDRDSAWVIGGDARLNWWHSPTVSAQFDVEGEFAGGLDECCGTNERWHVAVDAHFAMRDPNAYALGWLLGLVAASNTNHSYTATYGLIGVEGQRYLGATTLYGQAGYLHLFHGDEDAERTWFVRGVGRYFVDPDLKLSAEIGYARGHLHDNPSNTVRFVTWGLSAERRIPNSPASVFLAYTGGHIKSRDNPEDRAIDHTVMLGVRVYTNQATLLSNDRTGATFDKPILLRYLPWVGEAD